MKAIHGIIIIVLVLVAALDIICPIALLIVLLMGIVASIEVIYMVLVQRAIDEGDL